VRGHVGHRRTRRTRFGRARRGAGVTAGHCAAPASTRACRLWQVAGPGGVDLPAGAPPVARHWPPEWRTSPAMPSASLRVLVAPARPYLPQPTYPRAYKPAPAVPARTHASTRVAAVRHCRRLVGTIFQSLPSRTQELQPFPVHHNTSPSCLLIKSSHTFAGTRVPAAAAVPPLSSSPLRRFSKPGDLPSTFSRSHGSSPCSTWLSPGPSLTTVQLSAGAPPLLRRRRSPEPPPVDPPPPIGHR
jgi:hypothetical protein